MMIHHKLKTLNDLKVKIMKELQVNPTLHDIHIIICIIFRHYRLIKFASKFPSTGAHFSDHNSDEIYFSSLNVIIFFIISEEIHISSLKRYF